MSELQDLSEGEQTPHLCAHTSTSSWLLQSKTLTQQIYISAPQNVKYTSLTNKNKKDHIFSRPVASQEEDEFRDKLTPIALALNYSLAPPSHDQTLPPILNEYSSTFLQEHVGEE